MKKIFSLSIILLAYDLSAQTVNVQGEFEQWRNYQSGPVTKVYLEAPQSWFGLDSLVIGAGQPLVGIIQGNASNLKKQVFKSTDAHSGSNAVMMVTKLQDKLGLIPGAISNAPATVNVPQAVQLLNKNGDITPAISYVGGTAINQRVAGVNAYIKYAPIGTDQGTMTVQCVLTGRGANGKDSVVGSGSSYFSSTNRNYILTYTPIIYNDANVVPDKLLMAFASSANIPLAKDGSTLYVDDVTISGTAVTEVKTKNTIVNCYPNPSTGIINLTTIGNERLQWQAYSQNGQLVATTYFSGNGSVDMSGLPAGIYLYRISDKNAAAVQTGTFTIMK